MKKGFEKIINIGVKEGYQPWEIHLTRKINSISIITIINMILGISFFEITGYTQFIFDCSLALAAASFVLVLNAFKTYLWAVYWFFCYGFWFFIVLNLKMGMKSYMILYYFPVIISMVQLLGRKETLKHLIILIGICFLSVIVIAVGYKLHIYHLDLSDEMINNLIAFNIILSFLTTLAFIIVMVAESLSQENLIRKTLKEKEILLAEVFHRVKNNMNIITSLLNLKKDMSDSPEVQNALEDCRGRIFSMALVHDSIFSNNNKIDLNFKDYIKDLVQAVANSIGDKNDFEIILEAEDVNLELSTAIPCGLILNELITNSFKYGRSENKKLIISVKLTKQADTIEIELKDNGPGLPKESKNNKNTLGIELIKSLSEQINGTYSFTNNPGLVFKLKFKQIP